MKAEHGPLTRDAQEHLVSLGGYGIRRGLLGGAKAARFHWRARAHAKGPLRHRCTRVVSMCVLHARHRCR